MTRVKKDSRQSQRQLALQAKLPDQHVHNGQLGQDGARGQASQGPGGDCIGVWWTRGAPDAKQTVLASGTLDGKQDTMEHVEESSRAWSDNTEPRNVDAGGGGLPLTVTLP